jgi:hypothetical protein
LHAVSARIERRSQRTWSSTLAIGERMINLVAWVVTFIIAIRLMARLTWRSSGVIATIVISLFGIAHAVWDIVTIYNITGTVFNW